MRGTFIVRPVPEGNDRAVSIAPRLILTPGVAGIPIPALNARKSCASIPTELVEQAVEFRGRDCAALPGGILPTRVIYIYLERYLIRGMQAGAIKA